MVLIRGILDSNVPARAHTHTHTITHIHTNTTCNTYTHTPGLQFCRDRSETSPISPPVLCRPKSHAKECLFAHHIPSEAAIGSRKRGKKGAGEEEAGGKQGKQEKPFWDLKDLYGQDLYGLQVEELDVVSQADLLVPQRHALVIRDLPNSSFLPQTHPQLSSLGRPFSDNELCRPRQPSSPSQQGVL